MEGKGGIRELDRYLVSICAFRALDDGIYGSLAGWDRVVVGCHGSGNLRKGQILSLEAVVLSDEALKLVTSNTLRLMIPR